MESIGRICSICNRMILNRISIHDSYPAMSKHLRIKHKIVDIAYPRDYELIMYSFTEEKYWFK